MRGTGGGSTPTNGGYHHRPPLGCLKANDGQRPTVHRPQRRRGHVAPGLLLPPSGSRAGERPVKAAACPDPQGGRFPTTTPGARPLGGGGSGCQVWKGRGWEAPGDLVTGARLCPRSKTTCRWEAPGYFLSPRDSTLPTHTHQTSFVRYLGICSGRAGFRLGGDEFWWRMFKWAFPPPKFCPSLVRLVGFCGTWSFSGEATTGDTFPTTGDPPGCSGTFGSTGPPSAWALGGLGGTPSGHVFDLAGANWRHPLPPPAGDSWQHSGPRSRVRSVASGFWRPTPQVGCPRGGRVAHVCDIYI